MKQWLEQFTSGWPIEQKREVAKHVEAGRLISFMAGAREVNTAQPIPEWIPVGEEANEGELLSLKDEIKRKSLSAVKLKLPPGLPPAVFRKAALLRGVAIGHEPAREDGILLHFGGLEPEQIVEGLERLEEEIRSFTARYEA